MSRVLVLEQRSALATRLMDQLGATPEVESCLWAQQRLPTAGEGFAVDDLSRIIHDQQLDTVVYSPWRQSERGMLPDVLEATKILGACARFHLRHIVLLSDAAVYGADYSNPGFINESRPTTTKRQNGVAQQWHALESVANEKANSPWQCLTILRPACTLIPGGRDYLNRIFQGKIACCPGGYDPSIQLLSRDDLVGAICAAIRKPCSGVFNVAPDTVIPLRQALRRAGIWSIPCPRFVLRMANGLPLSGFHAKSHSDRFEYLRYSWTISNAKLKLDLGYSPLKSSVAALDECRNNGRGKDVAHWNPQPTEPDFDRYGMDRDYLRKYMRTSMRFAEKCYWRVEAQGIEHIPPQGGAVLVGVHRGLMPFDGVMLVQLLTKYAGRIPRFLAHPSLFQIPFIGRFLNKIGAVIACQENADYVLQNGEIVGVFPEGIRGAFRMYRDAYTLGKFGRDEFVNMALRHNVPIIPVATVGPAEIFPILARVDWRWWKRKTEWPFFPITPTWPLVPIPLPSKWHVRFLPPLRMPLPSSAKVANDRETVRSLSLQVRLQLQNAIDDMRGRRPSAFYGSIMDNAVSADQRQAKGGTI